MSVFCFDCSNFALRDTTGKALDVAHVGLGKCPTRPKAGQYVSGAYPRECGKFEPSEEGHGEKIRKWVDKHFQKFGGK